MEPASFLVIVCKRDIVDVCDVCPVDTLQRGEESLTTRYLNPLRRLISHPLSILLRLNARRGRKVRSTRLNYLLDLLNTISSALNEGDEPDWIDESPEETKDGMNLPLIPLPIPRQHWHPTQVHDPPKEWNISHGLLTNKRSQVSSVPWQSNE